MLEHTSCVGIGGQDMMKTMAITPQKRKNYGLWLPDYTILLLQSLKYIFKNWVWICLDSIFDRFCWDFRWFHKHRCWPWTLQFYFWNILDAGLEPSWFYFWNLLILFLQTPQLDDWWYWWFSLCATCGVELPWCHFCILGVSSLGTLDFILFFIHFSHSFLTMWRIVLLECRLSSFPNPEKAWLLTIANTITRIYLARPQLICIFIALYQEKKAQGIFIIVQLKNWTMLKSYWPSSAKEILL